MRTVVIPLASDLADCNYFDWVAVGVDRGVFDDADPTREQVREVVRSVKLADYDQGDGDIDVPRYKRALVLAFVGAGLSLGFIETGKLEWPGL